MCKALYKKFILSKRAKYAKKQVKKLKHTDFTIISSNCSGGIIYNRYGLKFLSPTINLWFEDSDYIKFIYNLKDFILNGEFTLIEQTEYDYPVAKLKAPCGEIKVYFMHYKTYEQAIEKWKERAKRINWDKIYYVWEIKPTTSSEEVKAFNEFDAKNKLIYSMKIDCDSPYLVKVNSKCNYYHGLSFEYKSKFSSKRWLDEVDLVKFFNS